MGWHDFRAGCWCSVIALIRCILTANSTTHSFHSVGVPAKDFARAAVAARDNFRIVLYHERGEEDFPEDTHFDSLDWLSGISEVWLYALRNARLALNDPTIHSELASHKAFLLDAQSQIYKAEKGIVSAWGKSYKKHRKAWRNARRFLAPGTSTDKLLQELARTEDERNLTFSVDGTLGQIGVSWPLESFDVKHGHQNYTLTNNVNMPLLGLGTTELNHRHGEETMLRALKHHGYRLIDTAQAYGNEAEVGRAVKRSGIERSDIFIVTKLSEPDDMATPETVRSLINKQLKKLQTTYIDLYLLHGPDDFPVGCVRAWRVLEDMYQKGVLRALGVSNFNVHQLREFRQQVAIAPHVVQNKFSIYHHGDAPMPVEPFVKEVQTSTVLDAPLGFMGYCNLDVYPALLEPLKDPHVARIASDHNRTPAQVLLRHALQMGTMVIPKTAGGKGRLAENADLFNFALRSDEMQRLNGLAQLASPHRIPHVSDLYAVHKMETGQEYMARAGMHEQEL